MPLFAPHGRRRLDATLTSIGDAVYTVVGRLDVTAWRSREPLPFEHRTEGEQLRLAPGDPWGTTYDCAWFHFTGEAPSKAAGSPIVLVLDVGGELLVVDAAGRPLRGLTNARLLYEQQEERAGKCVLSLDELGSADGEVDVWADASCNDLFDWGDVREARLRRADICDGSPPRLASSGLSRSRASPATSGRPRYSSRPTSLSAVRICSRRGESSGSTRSRSSSTSTS